MRFAGMRAVVTGAASGIGAEVARSLTAEGAAVTGIDLKDAENVERTIHTDLSSVESIDAAVAELANANGQSGWDVLCNVAGVPGTAAPTTVLTVNLLGLRHLTESLLPAMNQGGAIVNVASTAGFNWLERRDTIRELLNTDTVDEGLAWFAAHPQEGNTYNFSKEALIVYTMLMAPVTWEVGVRLNAVSPGPVRTPILGDFEETMGKDNLDGVAAFIGRHADPDDIAPAVLFLASPEARWINGHNIVADGGISAAVLSGMVPAPEI